MNVRMKRIIAKKKDISDQNCKKETYETENRVNEKERSKWEILRKNILDEKLKNKTEIQGGQLKKYI